MDDPTEYIDYEEYWDDPNLVPPCSCWCECCGCNMLCDESQVLFEEED